MPITMAFEFRIKFDGPAPHPNQLEAFGRGDTLAECLGDALRRWARNEPELAQAFTLDTEIVVGDVPGVTTPGLGTVQLSSKPRGTAPVPDATAPGTGVLFLQSKGKRRP